MGRRIWVVACLALLAGCDSGQVLPPASPGLELQQEDYAGARSGFRTRLVRKGPAPQRAEPLQTPPGAAAIDYASDGLTLKAYVSPTAQQSPKRPAVLFLHGGFAFGGDDWEMPRPYRDAGYVVMVPVLRGENGQDGDYTMYFDEVDDVLAAAAALAKLPGVDPGHIYLAGHSAGGALTLLAAMSSNQFRAAASFSGAPDQVLTVRAQPFLAPFDTSDLRELRLRSPVAYATSFKCPVRLYYGSQEGWIKPATRRTALLAQAKGLDVQAVELPGDHFSSVPEAIRRSIEFFRSK